jgi:hypothetical protein
MAIEMGTGLGHFGRDTRGEFSSAYRDANPSIRRGYSGAANASPPPRGLSLEHREP